MRSLLACALFLSLAVPARAELQCMARFQGSWSALTPSGSEVTLTRCPQFIFYPSSTPPQTYRLRTGPVKNAQQITCQWTWVPNGSSRIFPADQAPESIICNLFLAPN